MALQTSRTGEITHGRYHRGQTCILDFLRDNRSEVGDPLHEGPFYAEKIVHYDAMQKAAFHAAVEELVDEGLLEKRDDAVILTAKGQAAIS